MAVQLDTRSAGALAAEGEHTHWVFYDGDCGLCHGVVLWALPRDRKQVFLFAPLGGETFQARVPQDRHANLPDSIVVLTPAGELLLKGAAVRAMLRQIGGPWGFLGALLALIPRPVVDWGYDRIAAIRHHLFKKPTNTCPVVPPELRSRFRP